MGAGAATLSPFHSVRQHTLQSAVACHGVGLHNGAPVSLTLNPASPDSGILFRRTDLINGARDIPARFDHVVDTRLCTTLGNDHGTRVATVEHLLAALVACGVDNVVVALDGGEVPAMDGSADPFVRLIESAGLVAQPVPRRAMVMRRAVSVADGPAHATLAPGKDFSVSIDIDFANPVIGRQSLAMTMGDTAFKQRISRARTFGFLEEVTSLRKAGLARGGSLENTVVIDGPRVMNTDGLRYDDEFVRHKMLDCIGDMALAGGRIMGSLNGMRSGHAINNRLLRDIMADSQAMTAMPMDEWAETRGA